MESTTKRISLVQAHHPQVDFKLAILNNAFSLVCVRPFCRYELQACIEKFNVNADPEFFKHVLREEGIKEDAELDFDRFEGFLLRFLQHQVSWVLVLCQYIINSCATAGTCMPRTCMWVQNESTK